MELKRDLLEPNRFQYLSNKDLRLYAKVRKSTDKKDLIIKRLLEEKAEDCRSAHCNSRY